MEITVMKNLGVIYKDKTYPIPNFASLLKVLALLEIKGYEDFLERDSWTCAIDTEDSWVALALSLGRLSNWEVVPIEQGFRQATNIVFGTMMKVVKSVLHDDIPEGLKSTMSQEDYQMVLSAGIMSLFHTLQESLARTVLGQSTAKREGVTLLAPTLSAAVSIKGKDDIMALKSILKSIPDGDIWKNGMLGL